MSSAATTMLPRWACVRTVSVVIVSVGSGAGVVVGGGVVVVGAALSWWEVALALWPVASYRPSWRLRVM